MRALAGTCICPICHCNIEPFHVPTQCPLLAEFNLKLIACPPAKPSSSPTAPAVAPAPLPSPGPAPSGRVASTNLASLFDSTGLATASSGLSARVAPLKEDASEYDTDDDFSWEGDDSSVDFGDSPCKITTPVAPYPYPSCSHVHLEFSLRSAPLALFSIFLSTSIMHLLDQLSLSPALPSSRGRFAVTDSVAMVTMLPNKSSFISYMKVSGLNVFWVNGLQLLL
jgi:hypothetical protein